MGYMLQYIMHKVLSTDYMYMYIETIQKRNLEFKTPRVQLWWAEYMVIYGKMVPCGFFPESRAPDQVKLLEVRYRT